jgi:hypothetical protein
MNKMKDVDLTQSIGSTLSTTRSTSCTLSLSQVILKPTIASVFDTYSLPRWDRYRKVAELSSGYVQGDKTRRLVPDG